MSAFIRTASRAVPRPAPAVAAVAAAARTFSSTSSRSVARITIVGHLADTPEIRLSSNGRAFLRYAVGSNTGSGEHRRVSWFNVNSFVEGPRKDFLLSLPKGSLVMVEGEVTTPSYVDSEGKSRQGLSITHRSIDVLRRPHNPDAQAAQEEGQAQESHQQQQQ